MGTSPNTYGIRKGKLVEFRVGKLRKVTSKLTTTVDYIKYDYVYANEEDFYGKYVPTTIPKKVTIKQVSYIGGRVIGTCTTQKFKAVVGKTLTKGSIYKFSRGFRKEKFL